jgi:hypothetical protein
MPFSPQDWLRANEVIERDLVFQLQTVEAGTSVFGRQNWQLTILVPHPLFGSVVYGLSLPLEALAHAHAAAWGHWYRLQILPLTGQAVQVAQLISVSPAEAEEAQRRLEAIPPSPHLYSARHFVVTLSTTVGLPALLQAQRGQEAWQHVLAVNRIAVEDVTEPEARATIGTLCQYQFKICDSSPELAETVARSLISLAENWSQP